MIMNRLKECGLVSVGSRWDPLVGCCACGNEQPELRHGSTNTKLLPIPVGTASCSGKIYDFGCSRIWGLRCWKWEKAKPHERSESLLETGRVFKAIGKR